jgi:hypothetical protein
VPVSKQREVVSEVWNLIGVILTRNSESKRRRPNQEHEERILYARSEDHDGGSGPSFWSCRCSAENRDHVPIITLNAYNPLRPFVLFKNHGAQNVWSRPFQSHNLRLI